MADGGGGGGPSLEQTPTWAVAVVCLVLVIISIIIEHIIHLVGKWLKQNNKAALYEALERIKSELMLLGFISLLLTVGQSTISGICVSKNIGDSWHPCKDKKEVTADGKCAAKGKVPLISTDAINQLHIFIFVLAVVHILYCILTVALSRLKTKRWKAWELESKQSESEFYTDPTRFRFARETTFGRRHLSTWSNSPILMWIVCFFRQFSSSVPQIDYSTLRHGFIMAHLAPQTSINFDFQKYIKRSLEEDVKVVVGISPVMWFFALLFLLSNTHGIQSYTWLPFVPLIILLLLGTKLQVIITRMAIKITGRGDVINGIPVVQPQDNLFWFRRPRLLLFLIHFVLFQNAFQLAFLVWTWYEFGYPSCFHHGIADIIIRISTGILVQVVCSYITLPLYALVTQMGSKIKPTIFNERVATALRRWHHSARKRLKENQRSISVTPVTPSTPATSHHGLSPVHLLQFYRSEVDSLQVYRRENIEDFTIDMEGSPSPSHHTTNEYHSEQPKLGPQEELIEGKKQTQANTDHIELSKEIDIDSQETSDNEFSVGRRKI